MHDISQMGFEDRLELYFERAVQVWLLLKDEAGLVAALAAAKTFNTNDRQITISVLDNFLAQGKGQEDNNVINDFLKGINDLKEIIMSRDWTVDDGVAERARLKMVNPDYEQALVNGDPDIFVRKYPEYFSDGQA